ncbi:hypothetical protein D3C86_1937690 [compost metagenome]
MDDAHETASIALLEDLLALGNGADTEVARGRDEVRRQQLIEQATIHQPVANFVVQKG